MHVSMHTCMYARIYVCLDRFLVAPIGPHVCTNPVLCLLNSSSTTIHPLIDIYMCVRTYLYVCTGVCIHIRIICIYLPTHSSLYTVSPHDPCIRMHVCTHPYTPIHVHLRRGRYAPPCLPLPLCSRSASVTPVAYASSPGSHDSPVPPRRHCRPQCARGGCASVGTRMDPYAFYRSHSDPTKKNHGPSFPKRKQDRTRTVRLVGSLRGTRCTWQNCLDRRHPVQNEQTPPRMGGEKRSA